MPPRIPSNAVLQHVCGKRRLSRDMVRQLDTNPSFRERLLQLALEFSFNQQIRSMYAASEQAGSIVFPSREDLIDPNEFFRRKGIHLFGSFERRVLPVLESVAQTPRRRYRTKYLSLRKSYSYRQIFEDLQGSRFALWEDMATLIEIYSFETSHLLFLSGVGGEVVPVRVDKHPHRGVRIVCGGLGKNDRTETDSIILSPMKQDDFILDP